MRPSLLRAQRMKHFYHTRRNVACWHRDMIVLGDTAMSQRAAARRVREFYARINARDVALHYVRR